MLPHRVMSGFLVGGTRHDKPASGRAYYVPNSKAQALTLTESKCLLPIEDDDELDSAEDIVDGKVGVICSVMEAAEKEAAEKEADEKWADEKATAEKEADEKAAAEKAAAEAVPEAAAEAVPEAAAEAVPEAGAEAESSGEGSQEAPTATPEETDPEPPKPPKPPKGRWGRRGKK